MLQIVTKTTQFYCSRRKISPKFCISRGQRRANFSAGFSMMEMLIVLAILGIVLTFASSPDLELSRAKASFNNSLQDLQVELSTLHNEAMSRNTTTRMVITNTNDVYTINTYYAATAGQACSSAGTWTAMTSGKILDVHSKYQITGATALAGTCFDRDGTSSGGTFTISPKTANANLKTAVITVTIATGYQDVVIQ